MAGGGSAAVGINRSTSRGPSHLSDKQIARSVKEGRAIEVQLQDGSRYNGWVFGADNYHWGLVSPLGEVSLVHKSAARVVFLDNLLEQQPQTTKDLVWPLVAPFRDYVMRKVYNQTSAS